MIVENVDRLYLERILYAKKHERWEAVLDTVTNLLHFKVRAPHTEELVAVLLACRAEARLQLGRYIECLADCGQHLQMQPDNPYVLCIRIQASRQLGDRTQALRDCSRALRVASYNKRREIRKIRRAIANELAS